MASESNKPAESKKNLTKQLDDDAEFDYIVVPPDGGYGWVVLVACFVSSYWSFACRFHLASRWSS